MCTLYCPLRKKNSTLLPVGRDVCTHLAAHSPKRLNPLSVITLVSLGNTLKKQDCKTNCFIIGPRSVDFS